MIIMLLPLYAVLMVTQVIFYLYNKDILGGITGVEFGKLFYGNLKFDIIGGTDKEILDVERHFKAILKSYTKHVHDKDYIIHVK